MNLGSASWQNHGSHNNAVDIYYTNPEDYIRYPFNFNDTYTDTWSATYTINGMTFVKSGSTTVTYDSHGTLITPTGTLANVARIHFVQNYTDAAPAFTMTSTNDEFMWYANGMHYPLAAVFSMTNSVSGVTQMGFYSTFSQNPPTGIQGLNDVSGVSVYPNPASGSVQFSVPAGIAGIKLFDMQGRLVCEAQSGGASHFVLPVDQLPSGVYMASITTGDGSIVARKVSIR